MSGAAPVIAILIAIGLAQLSQLLHSQFTIHNSQFILLSLLAASLFFTVRDYFFRYATIPNWRPILPARLGTGAVRRRPTGRRCPLLHADSRRNGNHLLCPGRPGAAAQLQPVGRGLYHWGKRGKRPFTSSAPLPAQALADLQAFSPTGYMWPRRAPNFIAFHVPAAAPRLLTDQTTPISFADAIILRGWQIEPTDETLAVTLVWQAQTPISQDYTAFVHLLNETGELIAQLDRPPAGYPTSTWRVGELVRDTYRVPLPPDLPPGQYTVQTGFYSWPELVRVGETAVILGQFDR
jgi:hypothetical protein